VLPSTTDADPHWLELGCGHRASPSLSSIYHVNPTRGTEGCFAAAITLCEQPHEVEGA
jgi:hypothetical protein